jgi:TRAP transporter TAXI family solute receptor
MKLTTVLIALAAAALVATGAHAAEQSRFFRIGTAATGGTYFTVGGIIASAISSPPGAPECGRAGSCGVPGLIAIAQATQGSVENVNAIGAGQLESGFVQADVAYAAYRGVGTFEATGKIGNLRALAALFPESMHVVVGAGTPIAGLADLKGRHVSLGEKESGTLADTRLVLAEAGIKEKAIKAEYVRVGQAAGMVQDGKLDGFFLVAGYPVPAIVDLASTTEIRLLPSPDKLVDALHERFRYFRHSAIPGGTYKGVDQPTATLAVPALWVASAEVPDDLAYNIVKALWSEHARKLLTSRHALGERIRREDALDGIDIPLHPGAERYYREIGLSPEPPTR